MLVLGVNKCFVRGQNNDIYYLANIATYNGIRILGSQYRDHNSVGRVDISVYGNGGTITARALYTTDAPELYLDNRDLYIKFQTGIAVNAVCIGCAPVKSTIPSGATRLTITTY